jgi:hypothetical protein
VLLLDDVKAQAVRAIVRTVVVGAYPGHTTFIQYVGDTLGNSGFARGKVTSNARHDRFIHVNSP